MNDITLAKPPKLASVLIGAGAMIAISSIPVLNIVNCLCCAGIMGGAVLGVWYYRRQFPPELPFTVGDGATIGAVSGIVAGVFSPFIQAVSMGMFSEDFRYLMEERIAEAFDSSQISGADPVAVQEATDFLLRLLENPGVLYGLLTVSAVLLYAGFGALGGVIGGNIFKTPAVPVDQPADY